ncbi:cation diffusion facilitator family transporter [Corynebacterium comes]|uniref:Cadmium, cobalt and zinc/H(+)-K(+) antiporter n=1 Tax=Corynebacterium comes TaxID=2675218 RepID=A0A6B8VPH5_9CORY|nr:cation diffusion facilitator family transporter [Corynebacterium comes]QGU03314.1 Cadmium, cobalt and zinc/H(+)-K(+) antiporter [Corynebacterium comes]
MATRAHDHGHEHGFGGTHTTSAPLRALAIAFGITATVFFAELTAGLISGSLSLLSDAMHMFSDAAGLIIALLAALVGGKAASRSATFGYRRVEVLAALVNAVAVTVVVAWILIQALGRLGEVREIDTTLMLTVAVIGLVANGLSAWVLARHRSENLNVRGAFLHVLADMLGSVAVIIAGLVIRFTGWTPADTIASLAIVAFVLPRALTLLWQTVEVLLERVPRGVDGREVEQALCGLPGVSAVHDLHIWSTDGVTPLATCHLVVDDSCVDPSACGILAEAQAALHQFGIEHSTIQLEHPGHLEDEQVCGP